MAQQTQVRQINIRVDTKGSEAVRRMAGELGLLQRSTKSLAGNVGLLKNAFLGYFGALQVGQLARMSDEMQQLFDRITVLSGGTDQAKYVMDGLLQTANRTKSSIDGLATIYARLAASTKDTGISTDSLLRLTELLQNSFRLSGASIAESTAAAIQLSQGFASGQLRGQELRSVLEQNVVIGEILSKQFGVTRGELYKLAEAGELTAGKVMYALFRSMDDVNGKASQLSQTFEQTVTVAMNDFRASLLRINQEFDISGKFAKAVQFLIDSFKYIAAALVAFAATYVPAAIVAIKALTAAVVAFVASNPITLFLTAVGIGIVYVINHLEDFKNSFKEIGAAFLDFPRWALMIVRDVSAVFEGITFGSKKAEQALTPLIDKLQGMSQSLLDSRKNTGGNAPTDTVKEVEEFLKLEADLERLRRMQQGPQKEQKLKEILGEINKEFLKTNDAEAYYEALRKFEKLKITREFSEGKFDLEKFNLRMNELAKQDIFKEFEKGKMNMMEFINAVRANQVEELNIKLRSGTINLIEYNAQVAALTDKISYGGAMQIGLASYYESIGTGMTMLAESIKNTFGTLEEEIFQATKNGTFNFGRFAQAVLDDLTRIMIRALIIKPIVEGIMGGFGGSATPAAAGGSWTDYSVYAAKGAAFDRGVKKFANGGIVNSPTMFGYGNGKLGLMGEAGAEAILPLRRGPDGNLGVMANGGSNVVVNIINNSGAEVETQETQGPNGERFIDVMIQRKVNEGLAAGVFDKQMRSAYGVTRKGS